jgi:hypothetical protein
MHKVLALFSNPRGTSPLRLGEEDRTIRECFRRGKQRDVIELTVRHATTVDDIRRALLDDEFTMIHFSGHGTRAGLLFEDRNGVQYVPPQDALADLLAEYAPPLTCAVFNACYSLAQGGFTSVGLPFTVAMEQPIADPAAVLFSEAFYDSVAAGRNIEFSYRQGVHALRLARHPDHAVPILLRQGKNRPPTPSAVVRPAAETMPAASAVAQATIIGVAVDVSGSMEDSFDNRSIDMASRLETVRASIGRKFDAQILRDLGEDTPNTRVFSYAFGLRSGAVCDLFSMLKAAGEIVSRDEVDRLARQYETGLRARDSASGLGQLGALATSYGLGSFAAAVERIGENEVRRRVAAELQCRLVARLRQLGDTTLELQDFADFWKGSSARLADAQPLIYGNTPMCEALGAVRDRFRRELDRLSGRKVTSLLLVISDGEPTDGDPEPIAAEIRALGVAIISCYLTNVDVSSPRRLNARPRSGWPDGAVRLFNMASRLGPDSELSHYLLRRGWHVEPEAACFVQVNHSEVLDEFVGLATSPALQHHELLPKGR